MRFPNLIIVALTQYLLQYGILVPFYNKYYLNAPNFNSGNGIIALPPPQFVFLVLSTVCIAAAGYVINDIEDVEIDKINKSEQKQIVGRKISVRSAWILYFFITIAGLFISIYLAYYVRDFFQLIIYPIAVALLYTYSRWLKKMPLIGNLVVSFFCAFVAWVVLYAQSLNTAQLSVGKSSDQEYTFADFLFFYVTFFGYAVFAFLSTLFREIIKDMEDVAGDKVNDCKTLPIVLGMKRTKVIAFYVAILLLIAVYFFGQFVGTGFKFYLIQLLVSAPILFSLYRLYFAYEKKNYAFLSQFAKLIMLSGLVFIGIMSLK